MVYYLRKRVEFSIVVARLLLSNTPKYYNTSVSTGEILHS